MKSVTVVSHSSGLYFGGLVAAATIALPIPGYAALLQGVDSKVLDSAATQAMVAPRGAAAEPLSLELAIAQPDLALESAEGVAGAVVVDVAVPQGLHQPQETLAQMTEQEILDRLEQLEQEVEFLRQQLQSLDGSTADPIAEDPTIEDAIPENAASPTEAGGIAVSAELLYLRPSINASQAFAVIEDPDDIFDVQTLELGHETGVRLGLEYAFSNSPWNLRFAYTILSAATSGTITPPLGGRAGRARSVSDNSLNLNEPVSGINELSFLDYSLGISYDLSDTGPLRSRLFTGLRIAEINQSIFAREENSDEFSTSISEFEGYGPYIGGTVSYDLGAGLSIFGEGSISLLYGSVNQRLEDLDNRGTAFEGFTNTWPRLTTPVLALAAGINWRGELSETAAVQLSAAYEVQQWYGVVQGDVVNELTNTLQAGTLADLTLSGFRLGLNFFFEF